MTSWTTRLWRFILALLLLVMVTLAVAVTALRVTLPKLNQYQSEIESWVNDSTGMTFEIEGVSGYWLNTHPFISLHGLKAVLPNQDHASIELGQVDVEMDLLQSLLTLTPTVSNLKIQGLDLDISGVKWQRSKDNTPQVANRSSAATLDEVRYLLLHQLADFSLADSSLTFQTFTGEVKTVVIEQLKWRNENHRHRGEGQISVADNPLNSLKVQADFTTNQQFDLARLSGEFFVSASNLQLAQWLTPELQRQTGIEYGQLSFQSWLAFEQGKPRDAYVELQPSELSWGNKDNHLLTLEEGILVLKPQAQGWQLNAHGLRLRTDSTPWPELDWVLNWQPQGWKLNVSQLQADTVISFGHMAPQARELTHWLEDVQAGALLEDVRVSMGDGLETLRYSAQLSDGQMLQWELLPEVHKLSASLSGTSEQLRLKAQLVDDTLPYGDVFQAPLNIKQGETDLVVDFGEQGVSLWADKVTVATPDLQALGAFKLDFPAEGNAFLSFYLEADAFNAAETWRYLPTLALGQELTDYLSTAIQGGSAKTARLIWYGELDRFPYANNDGMFQADVKLNKTRFSFDTAWPPLTDMQLDLLFENDAMYLDSRSAKLMGVKARRVTGRIPELAEGGHIEIEAKAKGDGLAVRDYMMATPLVDSVGAALTAVEVHGEVTSEFQLNIPFDGSDARAWGWADLSGNHIHIQTPSMTLDKASGRIEFDDDKVSARRIDAHLLDQPVILGFDGEEQGRDYVVDIQTRGDWKVDPLEAYLGESWLKRVQGHAPWTMGVDLQLNDVGFNYQIDVQADLQSLASQYPAPLAKAAGKAGKARMQASGNQEVVSGRLQLPGVKYQAEISLLGDKPEFEATNLIVGKGAFRASPVVGHRATVRSKSFNLDDWLELFLGSVKGPQPLVSELEMPSLPVPTRIDVETPLLVVGGLDWHDVDFQARKKNLAWRMMLESAEASGQASYLAPYDLTIAFDRLQVYVPALEGTDKAENSFKLMEKAAKDPQPEISELDRSLHQALPNLTLAIDDFWFQGYKVGKVNIDFQRTGDKLEWRKVSLRSGTNRFDGSGWWKLDGDDSRSHFEFTASGDNNSDLMERFGISSGIQQAPFNMSSDMNWQGSPWSPRVETLSGSMNTELGPGVVSDVSGAARLLGLFSLDSIIRKMQLDFTGVFDKGMAFNKISGSGEIRNGIFVTNDIEMDAVAGQLNMSGMADLVNQQVDAEVEFTPDLTSGIPILSAFAATPQTAIYVFAITTALSPVIDVITQVRYEVKGPLDAPEVNELSRSKGKYTIPEELQKKGSDKN